MRKIETKAKATPNNTRTKSTLDCTPTTSRSSCFSSLRRLPTVFPPFLVVFFLFPFPFVLDAIVCCLKLEFEEQGVFGPKDLIVGPIYCGRV